MGLSSGSLSGIKNNRRLVRNVTRKYSYKENYAVRDSFKETDKLKPEIVKKADQKRIVKTLGYFLPILILTTIVLIFVLRSLM